MLNTIHKLEAQNMFDDGNANHESARVLPLPYEDQYRRTDGSRDNTNAGFQGRAQLMTEENFLVHLVRSCMHPQESASGC